MPTFELCPFPFRYPLTGKWIRARHKLQAPVLQRHYSEWEITGALSGLVKSGKLTNDAHRYKRPKLICRIDHRFVHLRNDDRKEKMLRMFALSVSLAICSFAAQGLTLAEVKAKSGVQLSADDLKQLMPDAKVVNSLSTGSTRRWTNKAEGTFVASTDGRSLSGGRNVSASGQGTWRLVDNGTYCVNIKWAC